jgi:hypothetical protein
MLFSMQKVATFLTAHKEAVSKHCFNNFFEQKWEGFLNF